MEDYRMDCEDRLAIRLAAGVIKRWHTIPTHGEQTVADHTYRVVQILRFLEPCPTMQLLRAALDHDVAEAETGDIPYNKKTADAVALEKEVLKRYKIQPTITEYEQRMLKAADLLEMGYYAVVQMNMGNEPFIHVLANVLEAVDPLRKNNDRIEQLYQELKDERKRYASRG